MNDCCREAARVAVEKEREACAKLSEDAYDCAGRGARTEIANRIRERSEGAAPQATPAPEPCTHGHYYLATMTCIDCGAPVKTPEGSGKARYTGPIGGMPPETGGKGRG